MLITGVCERDECARFYKHLTPHPVCIPGQRALCFSEVHSSPFPAWNHLSNQADISALSGIFPTLLTFPSTITAGVTNTSWPAISGGLHPFVRHDDEPGYAEQKHDVFPVQNLYFFSPRAEG
jgi:hypothetical protein